MKSSSVSIRISVASREAIRQLAASEGQPPYRLFTRAIEIGIAELLSAASQADPKTQDVVGAVAELSLDLSSLSQLVERVLLVSASGYAYARHAALRGERDASVINQQLADEASKVFLRQRGLTK